MSDDSIDPLGSEGQVVEIDESFVGGTFQAPRSRKRSAARLRCSALQSGADRVHLKKIKNLKPETIAPILEATISPNASAIHTDGSTRYVNLLTQGNHVRGNHSEEIKANQPISNQTIEGAFSLFKRGVVGSYHKLGEEHMDAYLGEFCWRFNRRREQAGMFDLALANMTREPLPYAKLKGGDNPF